MPAPRLADATVARARAEIPAYDRLRINHSVVHLGLGAFARAHLCVYLDDLLARGAHGLGVLGVSLRHDDVATALLPQDGLYTLAVIDGERVEHRIIGSVLDVVHAPTRPLDVRTALAAPTTAIVSATVTEKGYCRDPASQRLDADHPDVRHDTAAPEAPRSLPGHLVRAAADRRASSAGGFTALSLDNLPSNGATLRAVTLDLASLVDATLVGWIEDNVAFPSSMVDRIVPATDDALRADVRTATGVDDKWPVRAEPFSQWVVERTWAGPPPPLGSVGVSVVGDVTPWEMLKLRVLNALHTSAAHFGLFAGLDTVDRVVADRAGLALLTRVATDICEVLVPPPGVDPQAYVTTTLQRFANPGLGHRCAQIATDTSQKLPQRLLDTVRARMAAGLDVGAIAEVLALWAWSTRHPIDDPLSPAFAEIAARHGDDPDALLAALLALTPIFGDLAGNATLVAAVAAQVQVLSRRR